MIILYENNYSKIFYQDVPAGMLSKQYFQPNLPGAINYAVGAVSRIKILLKEKLEILFKVIGHEFTHAFDNHGIKYIMMEIICDESYL